MEGPKVKQGLFFDRSGEYIYYRQVTGNSRREEEGIKEGIKERKGVKEDMRSEEWKGENKEYWKTKQ